MVMSQKNVLNKQISSRAPIMSSKFMTFQLLQSHRLPPIGKQIEKRLRQWADGQNNNNFVPSQTRDRHKQG